MQQQGRKLEKAFNRTARNQERKLLPKQNKTKAERENNSEDECCIKKQKSSPPTYQNPR
jgi:hypothetical protein